MITIRQTVVNNTENNANQPNKEVHVDGPRKKQEKNERRAYM